MVKLPVFPNPSKTGEYIRGITVSAPIQNLNRNQMTFRRQTAAGSGKGITVSSDNSAYMSAMSIVIIGKPLPSDYVPESGNSVLKILMGKAAGVQHSNTDAAAGKPVRFCFPDISICPTHQKIPVIFFTIKVFPSARKVDRSILIIS